MLFSNNTYTNAWHVVIEKSIHKTLKLSNSFLNQNPFLEPTASWVPTSEDLNKLLILTRRWCLGLVDSSLRVGDLAHVSNILSNPKPKPNASAILLVEKNS